jgi:hypothetical protein
VASIACGTVLDRAKPAMTQTNESIKVINVTYSSGLALEGTRLASAAPIHTLKLSCINHNYLKCHL